MLNVFEMSQSPQIICQEVPAYDPTNLDDVRRAFAGVTDCWLQQSWLAKPEPEFEPASVRAGWRNDSLVLLAELKDIDIFTDARHPNERFWELGDTLEIFLRPREQDAYTEFHVAPNNLRTQLRFASAAALEQARKRDSFDDVLVQGDHFSSHVWVQADRGYWYALLEIPSRAVCDKAETLDGSKWFFSFCRCDHTRGRSRPVLSLNLPPCPARFSPAGRMGHHAFSASMKNGARVCAIAPPAATWPATSVLQL